MAFPVFIPTRYESRYDLLEAMADELAQAFFAAGCPINPPGAIDDIVKNRPGLLLFLNFAPWESIPPIARARSSGAGGLAVVQFFVDHPLAMDAAYMDRMVTLPGFRLMMPCIDSLHLLRLRWPTLRHAPCLHGVSPKALCLPDHLDREHLEDSSGSGRPVDIIITGSIDTEAELAKRRALVPEGLRRAADEMVDMLCVEAHTPFEQALDVCVGPHGVITGQWATAAGFWRYVSATVNRVRRSRIVRALEGLRVEVHGSESWREFCTGTIRYAGQLGYRALSPALARARVSIAWGPTQFTHSFSERVLLSLAAGCATIADDRRMIRKHFIVDEPAAPAFGLRSGTRGAAEGAATTESAPMLRVFDASTPQSVRAVAESLLGDRDRCLALARAGRAEIERAHLWVHRLQIIGAIASDALAAA